MAKTAIKDKVIWGTPSFWIEQLPVYYALEYGMFRKRDIDLEIKYHYGGPELCSAIAAGDIQVGGMGLPPFLKAYTEGLPSRVIGSTPHQQLDHYLVARPEIRTMADLKGKKIGILSAGSCDSYFIRRMLRYAGLDSEADVVIKSMGKALGGDLSCFANGDIDAGFVVEPKISLGESRGLLHVLARVGDYYPSYQWCVMFATDTYLEENFHLITQIIDAYREACRAIQHSPETAMELGAKVFHVAPAVFGQAMMRDMGNWEFDARIDLEGIHNAVEVQKQMGVIQKDPDIQKMVRQM